jgi:hypothetical protein
MIGVMWAIRTRVRYNWIGHGNTYRSQILADGQFPEYDWLHPNSEKMASRGFMLAFDPKGRDYVRGDTQTFDWYKIAHNLAVNIMALPYEQMPPEWRRFDSWVSIARRNEHIASGDTRYATFQKEVDGNAFGNWMSDDDKFWDKQEGAP